jgi:hypothetical protein
MGAVEGLDRVTIRGQAAKKAGAQKSAVVGVRECN